MVRCTKPIMIENPEAALIFQKSYAYERVCVAGIEIAGIGCCPHPVYSWGVEFIGVLSYY
ncbi:hypothetical protein DSCOOX_07890 [Desulfosarcina ovata subsp. ovata]|uniref:Uncharacterized protein n=1 Tax=Desulfosarcina ovata subsp. ovata TaxID=2752305 RepID=A0A5K8A513_9BACT|nr:hypothetical protein DSCOOX_07890 [Desulfosarcina ovata subsp. ovata]